MINKKLFLSASILALSTTAPLEASRYMSIDDLYAANLAAQRTGNVDAEVADVDKLAAKVIRGGHETYDPAQAERRTAVALESHRAGDKKTLEIEVARREARRKHNKPVTELAEADIAEFLTDTTVAPAEVVAYGAGISSERAAKEAETVVTLAKAAEMEAGESKDEAIRASLETIKEEAAAARLKAEEAAVLAAKSKAKVEGQDEAAAEAAAKAALELRLEEAVDIDTDQLEEFKAIAAARKAEQEEAADAAAKNAAQIEADRRAALELQAREQEAARRAAAAQKADDDEAARRAAAAAAADQAKLLKAAETLDQFKADFEEAFGDAKTKAIVSQLNKLAHADLVALAQAAAIDYDAIVAALSKVDVKPMLSALVHLNIIDDKTTLEGLIKSGNGFTASHGLLTVARLVPNFAAEGLDPNVLAAFKAIEEAISRDQYRQLGLTKPGDLDTYYYPTEQEISMYGKTLKKIKEAEAALVIVRAHPKANATQIAVVSRTVDQFKQMFTGIMAQARKLIDYVNTNFDATKKFGNFDAVQRFVHDFETDAANDALKQKFAQQHNLEGADLVGLAAQVAAAKEIKEDAETNEAALRAASDAADKAHTDFAVEANQDVDLGDTTGQVNVANVRKAAVDAKDAVADNARKIAAKTKEVDALDAVVADHEQALRAAEAEKSKLKGERDAAARDARAAETEIGLKKPLLGKDGCIDHSAKLPRVEAAKVNAEAVVAALDTDDKVKLAQFIVDNFDKVKAYQDAVSDGNVTTQKQAVVEALLEGTEPLAGDEDAARKLTKPLRDVYVAVSKIDSATDVDKFRDLLKRAAHVDQVVALFQKMTAETDAFKQLNAELEALEGAKVRHEQEVAAKADAITAEEAKMDAAVAALDETDDASDAGALKAATDALDALKAQTAALEKAKDETAGVLDAAIKAADAKLQVLLAEAQAAQDAYDENADVIAVQNDADEDGSYANLKAKQDELKALKLTDAESDVLEKLTLAREAIASRPDFAQLSGKFKAAREALFKALDTLAQSS